MPKVKKFSLYFKGSVSDFNQKQLDRDYWKNRSTTEKFQEAQQLADFVIEKQGKTYQDVSGLLRTTAIIKRF